MVFENKGSALFRRTKKEEASASSVLVKYILSTNVSSLRTNSKGIHILIADASSFGRTLPQPVKQTRTPNPRNRNPMLYPLSHRRVLFCSLPIITAFFRFVKGENENFLERPGHFFLATTTNRPLSTWYEQVTRVISLSPYWAVTPVSYKALDLNWPMASLKSSSFSASMN